MLSKTLMFATFRTLSGDYKSLLKSNMIVFIYLNDFVITTGHFKNFIVSGNKKEVRRDLLFWKGNY